MDNKKIGEFIKTIRKEKNLTQTELAEKLMVSDKTVSKWECGAGAPDVSLMIPLCEELGITVNELLSGERLGKEEYMKKAEENFISVLEEGKKNKKNTKALVVLGIASFLNVFLVMLAMSYMMEYKLLEGTFFKEWMGVAIIIFEFIILFATVIPICILDNGIAYFKCRNCGKTFRPTDKEYIMAVHAHTARKLKCPHCGAKTWCKRVLVKETKKDIE